MDAVTGLLNSESLPSPLVWDTLMAKMLEKLITGRTSIHPSPRPNYYYDMQYARCMCNGKL